MVSMQQVFQIHEINCSSPKCILTTCLRGRLDELEYCRKMITQILQSKKYYGPQNHLLSELWLLQTESKVTIQFFQRVKDLSLTMQYIIQSVKDSKKNVLSRSQSKSKTQLLKTSDFYSQIDITLQSFSRFYAEIQKPQPQFQTLVESGYECKINTIQLQSFYNQNLKTNTMTFKMLEIYLQFQVRYGISEQTSSKDWVDKVSSLQKNQSYNSIDELYLPTIYVNSTTGIIENSNMQACYFLKMSAFQLKLKPIQQIFQTQTKIEYLTDLITNHKSSNQLKCIIKRGNQEIVCSKLFLSQKTIDNHRVVVLSFSQQKLFNNKNIFLVDQQFSLINSIRKSAYFKTYEHEIVGKKSAPSKTQISSKKSLRRIAMNKCSTHIGGTKKLTVDRFLLEWEEIYEKNIKIDGQKLKEAKILKIKLHHGKNLLLIVHLEPTISKQNFLVMVTIISDNSQRRSQNRLSVRNSMLNQDDQKKRKQSVFKFYYFQYTVIDDNASSEKNFPIANDIDHNVKEDLLKESLTQSRLESQSASHNLHLAIVGQAIDQSDPKHSQYLSSSRNFEADYLIKNISHLIVNEKFLNVSFSKGIKTYRLWKDSLYNIDLQDKQAYVESIQDSLSTSNNDQSQQKQNNRNLGSYLLIAIVILTLALTISVFSLFNSSITDFNTILSSYKKQMYMQSIYLSTNKINAVFRDVQNGFYQRLNQSWQTHMITSFNNIKKKRMIDLNLFQPTDLPFVYNNVSYQGNLNQLLDLFLSETGSLVASGDQNFTKMKKVQQLSLNYISPYFTIQRQYHFSILLQKSNTVNQSLSNSFYISLSILIVIQIILVKMFFTVMQKLKEKLNFILLTSDNEAKVKFQNSEKIRYMIEMIQKNYDVDVNGLLDEKNQFRKRKKSKTPKYNVVKKIARLGIILAYFIIHIVYVSLCQQSASQNIDNSTEMFNLGRSLMRCYSRIVQSSTTGAYSGVIKQSDILEGQQSVQFIQNHRGNSAFGSRVDSLVQEYMFGYVCDNEDLVSYLFTNETIPCDKATPTFQIQNSFQLGVLQYIRRMQYELVNNITQTFAVSGVYSTPFARLFNLLATQFLDQGVLRINGYIDLLSSQNVTLIILSLAYIIFGGYLLWLESSFGKQIKIVTDFFKSRQENRFFKEQKSKQLQKPSAPKKKSRQFRTSISQEPQQSQNNSLVEKIKSRKNTNFSIKKTKKVLDFP